MINAFESDCVDVLVEVFLAPVVTLDDDGQDAVSVAFLDGCRASVGCAFQFALVIGYARQVVQRLARNEKVFSIILQRSKFGVVDEFHIVYV